MSAPFSIQRLDHVVLRTDSIERLLPFYLALGMNVERDLRGQFELVQLRAGDSIVDLLEEPDKSLDPAGANLDHLALRVEPFDRQALEAFCRAHNISFTVPGSEIYGADGFGPAMYLHDPDGNRIELKGPPTRSLNG